MLKKSKRFRYILFTTILIICCALGILFLVHSAKKDKTALHITVDDLENEKYYMTLLSSEECVEDAQVYNGSNGIYELDDPIYPVWEKLACYEDEDGYFFLQEIVECQGNTSFVWDSYIPENYKILLYFPEDDFYVVTSIRDDDLADYYIIHMDEAEKGEPYIPVKRYHAGIVVFFLLIRVAGVVWVELSIALVFKYNEKRQLLFVVIINSLTYLALNVYLSYLAYIGGAFIFILGMIVGSGILCLAKIALYSIIIPLLTREEIRWRKLFAYAFSSNVLSNVVAKVLAVAYAGIF